MFKRSLLWSLLLSAVALGMAGCSSNPTSTSNEKGTLIIFAGDVPLCNLLSFRTNIASLTLTPQGGSGSVSVLASNTFIPLDFAALRDTTAVADVVSVSPGTYTGGQVQFSASSMALFDSAVSPPIDVITPTLSSETVNFTINPPLVVQACSSTSSTPCQAAAMNIDFNLAQSIELTAQGQVNVSGSPGSLTVKVTPVVNATTLAASGSQGFGALDDFHGYILSVNNTSTNSNFIGSFVVQTLPGFNVTSSLEGAGPAITVNLTKNTQLIGAAALNQITTGNFVEINGYVDSQGNFIANTIVIEDQTDLANDKSAFLGYVISVTKDSSGNLTQFQLYVHDQEPNTSAGTGNSVPLDTPPVIVNVSTSTGFHFSAPAANFPNLTPDSTFLNVGQQLVVHGTYTAPARATPPATTPPSTVDASNVYIPLQTVSGNFSALLTAGADNLSGAFRFVPCFTLFQGQNIYVITNAQTQFINVNGLAGLSPSPQLQVRGLLFFDQSGGPINGIQIPPNSYVLLANRVHLF